MPDKIREHSIDHTESTTIAMRWKSPINSEFSKPLETGILYEISYVSEWGARNVSTVSLVTPVCLLLFMISFPFIGVV